MGAEGDGGGGGGGGGKTSLTPGSSHSPSHGDNLAYLVPAMVWLL